MRLGVVSSSFPRAPGDHAGAFVLEVCLALVERGHQLEVLAPDPGHGSPPRWRGIDVKWIPYFAPRPWQQLCYGAGVPENVKLRPWLVAQAPLLGLSMVAAIRARKNAWDGVMSHWLLPSGLSVSLAIHDIPHVAVAHSGDVWLLGKSGAFGAAALRQIVRHSKALAAVNPSLADALTKLPSSVPAEWPEVVVMPLGPSAVLPARTEVRKRLEERLVDCGITASEPVVVSIGRLVPIKGIDVLIRAIALPAARGYATVIAGAGPERSRLETLARHLNVKAVFLGPIDAEERAALLGLADVLAVPSLVLSNGRTEGTPVAALEGMAAGVPVVASNVGGLGWAVGDAGLLVEPGSPEGLAAALSAIRDDERLRDSLAHEAHRRSNEFGWARTAELLEGFLL